MTATDPPDKANPPDGPSREGADPLADEPDAAHSALARARAAAVGKGLRPGMKPAPRRRFDGSGRGTAASGGSAGVGRSGAGPDRRDPALVGDQLEHLLADRGWQVDVAAGQVMGRWEHIVGADIAEHARPVTFEAGVLTVRTSSTAWATQLRLMTSHVLARIEAEVGPGQVAELRVVGPSAPSWRKGPRRSPDSRGPRDTYG